MHPPISYKVFSLWEDFYLPLTKFEASCKSVLLNIMFHAPIGIFQLQLI